jgi:hypothetical protein
LIFPINKSFCHTIQKFCFTLTGWCAGDHFTSLKHDENRKRSWKKKPVGRWVHAVVFMARSPKSRIVNDLLNVVYGEIQHEDKKLPIPDYALDKHTLKGAKMGRKWNHFFTEGNRLKKEPFKNPYTARAKELLIKYGGLKPEFCKHKDHPKPSPSKTGQTTEQLEAFMEASTDTVAEA